MTLRTKPTSVERDLLASLGLPADASSQEVETAHDELVAYLEKAPAELRLWARREIASIDEAFALLSDPTIDRSPAGDEGARPAVVAATAGGAKATPAKAGDIAVEDEVEELELDHPATRHGRREAERRARAAAKRAAVEEPRHATRNRLIKRLAIGAAAVVGVIAVASFGYNMNGGTGIPALNGTPIPELSAGTGVDEAQLAALMQKISADPKDTASLRSIGDLYYDAGDYPTAAAWMEKVIAIDPNDTDARLALGAAMYNQSRDADAEKQWRQVIAVDPKNALAYYDLGFLYLSQNPPDIAKVKTEWAKVIEIDPTSDLAQRVTTHLQSLEGSPGPSVAPASAAPAESGRSHPGGDAGPEQLNRWTPESASGSRSPSWAELSRSRRRAACRSYRHTSATSSAPRPTTIPRTAEQPSTSRSPSSWASRRCSSPCGPPSG